MAMEQILVNGVTELLKPLISLISQQITSAWGVKDDLTKLKGTLESIQALITSAEEKQVNDPTVRLWLRRLKDVVYDADDIMDEFSYETMRRQAMGSQLKCNLRDLVSPSNPLVFYSKMSRKVRGINKRLDEIYIDRVRYSLNASSSHDDQTRDQHNCQTSSVVDDSVLIGRDDAKSEIVKILSDKLLPPSSSSFSSSQQDKVSTVSIVGMGGLGKTSLAQLVYNDESIGNYFELKMWVCISDDFKVPRILKNILESITRDPCGDLSNFDVLANKVKENLTGKKYLLVLDDLWNEDAEDWEKLKNVLVCGGLGSKILVTTRNQVVASVIGGRVHDLEILSDDVCWSIIEKKVLSQGGAVLCPEMITIGKQIAEKCDGLPLAAKSLGSLMCSKRNQSYWLSIINNNDLWSTPAHKKVISILKLSYDNLSSPLKQCFSYCCIFPKDWEIRREMLIRLWMAEGFLSPSVGEENISLEDLGNEYFEYLMWCSFFQDVQKDLLGDITTCKMHDLVHDLATSVQDSSEFGIANVYDGMKEVSQVRRLRLLFDKGQSLSPPKVSLNAMQVRTVIALNPQHFSHINYFFLYKRLRTLGPLWPNSWYNCSLSRGLKFRLAVSKLCLASSISKLKHLRYLDLSWINLSPEVSLNHCYNLQTLILLGCKNVPSWLLSKIGSLKKLRHLDISSSDIKLIPENIGSSDHLSFLDVSHTKISRLPDSIACLSSLRTLSFKYCPGLEALPSELGALTQLRCLDLHDTSIQELPESCISGLCNLEIVNLGPNCELPGEIKNWPKLRILTHYRRDDVMPRGIERLTCLETLQSYNVRKENETCGSSNSDCSNGSGIGALAGLNSLQVLRITNLESVRGGKEGAESAKLKDKQHLWLLHLYWGSSTGDDEQVRNRRNVKDETVLEGLQPHPNVNILRIKEFSGLKLPKWMGSSNCLPNLVELHIWNCNSCEKLPALGMLPFLAVLNINGLKSIKCLGDEFYYQQEDKDEEEESSTKRSSLFPSLVELDIGLSENLEEWVAPPLSSSSCFPSLERLGIYHCNRLRTTPPIISFTSLHMLTLGGTNENVVNSLFNRVGTEGSLPPPHLPLRLIRISESPDIIYLPPLGVLLQHSTPNLQKLEISGCSNFQGFRDDDLNNHDNINSLRSLYLQDCPVLTSLPDLRVYTSLQELEICKCNKLKESIPYDLKKSLTFLEELRVDFIQRDEKLGDPDDDELINLMEKK